MLALSQSKVYRLLTFRIIDTVFPATEKHIVGNMTIQLKYSLVTFIMLFKNQFISNGKKVKKVIIHLFVIIFSAFFFWGLMFLPPGPGFFRVQKIEKSHNVIIMRVKAKNSVGTSPYNTT